MIATAFDEETTVLHPPEGMTSDEVFALSVGKGIYVDGNFPVVVSCWKPTAEEWEEMRRTGRVWVAIMGHTMPPVIISGHNPYEQGWIK